MEARTGYATSGDMKTFEPLSDLIQEEDCNTLLLYLPGFTKEQLRVQLTRSRVLKISGSRPIGDNKFSNFQKDFPVSENIDTNKITAKFEDGILYLRQPKLIVPAEKDNDQKTPPLQPAEKPPAAAPKTDQESRPRTTPNAAADGSKQTEKSKEKKEEKPSKKEERDGELEGSRKDERRHVPEKSGGGDGDKKAVAGKSDGDKRGEKVSGSSVDGGDKVGDYSKVDAAAMLKVAREKMMKILLFLFAFGLGIYVSRMRGVSREVEN